MESLLYSGLKNIALFYIFTISFGFSQDWKLVWSDEFNGPTGPISSVHWFHQTQFPNGSSWYNGEIQHYTNRTDNSYVSNGTLKIVAKKETYTNQGHTKQYTSARLNSKYAFGYGRVEIKAKLPKGVGTWPAIWMLGKNIKEPGAYWQTKGFGTTSWPACGEVDLMEHWGSNQNYVQSAIHTPSSHGGTVNLGGQYINTATTQFHIYTIDWSEEKMVFSVDGNVHYTYNPATKNSDTWPFDSKMYLLLNIAIESNIASSFTESEMEIDYIRIFRNNLGISTNQGEIPELFKLLPAYPNPFNPSTKIDYVLSNSNIINLSVYDIYGRQIEELLNEYHRAGEYSITWDASRQPSGIYFIRAFNGEHYFHKKITLLK